MSPALSRSIREEPLIPTLIPFPTQLRRWRFRALPRGRHSRKVTSISFGGSAIDQQDGSLTAVLSWTSNVDGQIGTGGSFSRVLWVGTHVISAGAIDSGGLSALNQVTVTVTDRTGSTPTPTPTPTLTANGYKWKG